MGGITVFTGGMFAGKTTKLLEIIHTRSSTEQVKVFRPRLDTRDLVMKSHDGIEWHEFTYVNTISDIIELSVNTDLVVIDEIQFLFGVTDDELIALQKLSVTKSVVCAGLDLSFKLVPFETTAKIMAIADSVVKLRSVCDGCRNPSQLTTIKDTTPHLSTYLPGSGEMYKSMCRNCVFKLCKDQKTSPLHKEECLSG